MDSNFAQTVDSESDSNNQTKNNNSTGNVNNSTKNNAKSTFILHEDRYINILKKLLDNKGLAKSFSKECSFNDFIRLNIDMIDEVINEQH